MKSTKNTTTLQYPAVNETTVLRRIANTLRSGLLATLTLSALAGPVLVAKPDTDLETSRNAIIRFRGQVDAALIRRHGGQVGKDLWIINGMAAKVPLAAWTGLARNPQIASLEVDGEARAIGKPVSGTSVFRDQQTPSNVRRVGAEGLLNTGFGVKVAILDSGMGPNADLPPAWKQKDFVHNDNDATDDAGHGTHVAGTIAAVDNEIGIIGVAPGVDLIIGKVLNRRGSGSYSDIIAGIQWAVSEGAQVINLSLSGETSSQSLHDAVAIASATAVVVAAAGNDAETGNNVQYPAAYDEVIAVAAATNGGEHASFSSYGYWIDIAAPGWTFSTMPDDLLAIYYGTSMAAPHVAGCAALAWNAGAGSPAEVRERLLYWAEDLGATGWDEQFGAGMVDAVAVQLPVPPPAPVDLSVILEGPSSAQINSMLNFTVTVHSLGSDPGVQTGTVSLWRDDDHDGTPDVELASSLVSVDASAPQVLNFTVTAGAIAGSEDYMAVVTADGADGDPFNDVSWSIVDVIDPGQTALLYVSAIEYSETKRDLRITLTIRDATNGEVVPGALVGTTLNRNGSSIGSASATTGDTGQVTFRLKNASSGSYTTTVDQVSLDGAIYDPTLNVADQGWVR